MNTSMWEIQEILKIRNIKALMFEPPHKRFTPTCMVNPKVKIIAMIKVKATAKVKANVKLKD